MKNFTYHSRYVILAFLLFFTFNSFAQRNYATTENSGSAGILCVNCIVANKGNAIDGNLQTYSTINVTVGVASSTYQDLIFPAAGKVPANTPVTIKLGTGDNLADVTALGSITVRALNGNTAAGPAIAANTLVTAASNNNQYQLTITPNQVYDRVRITLNGGLLGALSSLYVYEAYYNGNADVACNNAYDELHGVSSALLNLGVDVGGVANPQRAIDGNITTASTLNAGVAAVGAYAQQTILYERPSVIGDSVRLTLSIPQALIDAGVTANISVRTYNGNTDNNDAQTLSGGLLTVRLLDLSNNRRRMTVTYAPTKVFDRVQLRLGGGIASVLSSLNFYEAQKLIPKPIITFDNVATNNAQICAGSTATLVATAVPNTTFNWYAAATGGTPVHTGASFTTPVLNTTTTYYVSASRNGCTDESERTAIKVTVNQLPANVIVNADNDVICPGETATFTATTVTGVTVRWYTTATGGTPIFTGNTFTTPVINADRKYYAEAVNAGGCPSRVRTAVSVELQATPVLSATAITISSGQTATIRVTNAQPGVTYNWYTQPTGGAIVHTGATFSTPKLTANRTYYVQATSANCSSARAQVTITVSTEPDVVVTPPTQSVNAGDTAVFTASSSSPDAIFKWYTTPTGGTSIFTGPVFTTPEINENTTYYAEAVNPNTNEVSSDRATGTVTINNGNDANPDVVVNPPTQAVTAGQTATFTASSSTADATFKWYATPTGGTALFTGNKFTTPPVNEKTTYYAEATNPTTNTVSEYRATGTVTVNGGANSPDIKVTPPTRTVSPGETTMFRASSTTPGATFKWYTTPTGGTPVFTGATFTTPEATTNTTYYAEATNPSTGIASQNRATATVNISKPDVAVTPPTQAVAAGGKATFTASSSTPNAVFDWYATPTGGTPIFTGATFTTPAVNANTTYYAQATNPTTGGVSPDRATGTVTVNGGSNNKPDVAVTPSIQTIDAGETAKLVASSSTANAIFTWYTTPTGGTPIFTGATFTTPALNANTTYYAQATSSTGAVSANRATGTVNVSTDNSTRPDITVTPPTRTVNPGETTTFTASSTTPGATFKWYTTPTGGTPVFTGATFTTPRVTKNTTYYAEATIPSSGATSQNRTTGNVRLNKPDVVVTPPTQAVNAGETATFIASSTTPNAVFDWYTTPTGGTPIFTGSTFTTPPVNANTTYYAQATNPATGGVSPNRATGTVTVNGNNNNSKPDVVVNPPIQAITAGQTATLIASSSAANATFRWYTAPTGGSPVFTGATFTTPTLSANTTYYAQATNPSTGAISANRATGTVIVLTADNDTRPDVTVTPPVAAVNAGEKPTFTATSTTPGATFNWYNTPTGESPIFTGNTFTTPPATTNTTYYVEAIDPVSGFPSSNRATAVVTVNGAGNGKDVFAPNAFSPNGDGNNDVFYVYGNNLQKVTFSVYDQWGEMQFRSTSVSSGWDGTYKGTAQPVGVYVYYVEATTNAGQLVKKKGTITLLR